MGGHINGNGNGNESQPCAHGKINGSDPGKGWKKTTHHIDPTSRLKGKGILGVCKVPQRWHELYHSFFGNMCPEEIIEFLNENFWNGAFDITISLKSKVKQKHRAFFRKQLKINNEECFSKISN